MRKRMEQQRGRRCEATTGTVFYGGGESTFTASHEKKSPVFDSPTYTVRAKVDNWYRSPIPNSRSVLCKGIQC